MFGLPVILGISLHDENQQRLAVSDVRTTALVRWALIWGFGPRASKEPPASEAGPPLYPPIGASFY